MKDVCDGVTIRWDEKKTLKIYARGIRGEENCLLL